MSRTVLRDVSYNRSPGRLRPSGPPKRSPTFPCPNLLGTASQFHAGRTDIFSEGKVAEAKAGGFNPHGKTWSPQLNTWIDGPDDVKRICKANGWGCTGSIEVKENPPEQPDPGPYRVADDEVEKEVGQRLFDEDVTEIKKQELDDLTEKVREDITPMMGDD